MNIVLLGYRGSGKTTIGRKLADQLWKTFVDTDDLIRQRFGNMTIAEIWQQHGEPAFRAAEVEVTREVLAKDDQVIALGGGTVMQPEARAALEQAEHALRVYLKCPAEVLYQRIQGDAASTATRPNLTGLGGGIEEVATVLAERDPIYQAVADTVFDVTYLQPDDAVRHLIQKCL